ncbi:cell wall-active antibiotics response protein LiaF [Lactococcus kimchii]|uniref:cell wall-active antibiotics response protein LiaF n=1 Tax=Lactococcus sp. S-13 TaxID=2507158 RepID=UPI001680C7F8|nr:cell wall-active antibiotics response protein LiaF [Lactococcus sp. S-13]
MNKKLKAVIIIEIFIVLGLIFRVVHTPHLWIFLVLTVIFGVLATRSRSRAWRILSFIFGAISGMILFTVSWFWLAIIFPAIMCIIFWKNNPREQERQVNFAHNLFQNQAAETYSQTSQNNGNDVIDLDDVVFKPTGNSLSIKKMAGNTKIIVPEDVAVALDLTTNTGLIKIFNEATQINASNVHYFSENLDEAPKRIKITIRVDTGNIEVVQG